MLIEDLPPATEKAGLTVAQLRTDVELRLRQSRITVGEFTETLPADQKGTADERASYLFRLYVQVNVMETLSGFVFSAQVKLGQPAYLLRDLTPDDQGRGLLVLKTVLSGQRATTWDRGKLGHTPREGARDHIRSAVRDLVDTFINDFLAVNPAK